MKPEERRRDEGEGEGDIDGQCRERDSLDVRVASERGGHALHLHTSRTHSLTPAEIGN